MPAQMCVLGCKIPVRPQIFPDFPRIDDNVGCVLKNTLLRRVIQLGVDLDLDLYPS
jgi:hypothetical protein